MTKLPLILFLFLASIRLQASVETTVSYLHGVDFLHYAIHGSASSVTNTSFLEMPDFNPLGNPNWENGFKISWVKSRVELYIDPAGMPLTYAYKLTIPIKISFLDINHTLHEENHNLVVDYNPDDGSAHRQLDLFLQEGAYRFQIDVLSQNSDLLIEKMSVASNPSPPDLTQNQKVEIANAVKIKLVQEYDKILNFDYLKQLVYNELNFNFNATTNQLKICWDVIKGAEEYDLEWCYVEKYLVPYVYANAGITNSRFYFSANASRVTITENCYAMPVVYESGALVFRVRGKGRVLPDLDNIVIGNWSCGNISGNCISYDGINPSLTNWLHTYWIHDPHEADNKNWQVITSFAEEGKRKDVVNYMDGTMRTKQTITVNNSDNNVLVAETIYDHQGRPAVQILPAPVLHDPALKFRNNFNRNLANQPYGKRDFDLDGPACNGQIAPLNSASGAAFYYSPQFYNLLTPAEKETHLAYIPKSEGFPLIQTEYTPDNTGRIQRQGGTGPTFQLESGHETKYFYATPAQEELDYLFGTNVGIASHYKKNMLIDPNGQVSISYLDAKGNTIATALAAKAPDNMEQLPSYHPFPMTIDLLAYNRVDSSNYSLDATFTLAVDSKGDHTFYYGVTAEQFNVANCMPANVCYDCVYDLELLVVSNECPDTFYHLIKTIGSFIDTSIVLDVQNQDSMVFNLNTTCNTPVHFNTNLLPINNEIIISDLPVGTYSIIKKLKVNQTAAMAYLHHYINDPNNICTNILEDILQEQLDDVNEDDCHIDCEDVAGSTDDSDIELAKEVCDTLLTNPCDIAYEVMKSHFMPGGQYAQFEPSTFNANAFPLSIFNLNNKLKVPPINYQNIWGSGEAVIIDGDTRLMNSLTVQEFIQNFDEAWLETLVTIHPEYCMYERCRDSLAASETYTNYLHLTSSLQEANSPTGITPAFIYALNDHEIMLKDPYFFQQGATAVADNPGPGQHHIAQMMDCMNHFPIGNTTDPSITELALANSFCPGPFDPICISLVTWADLLSNVVEANTFWSTYKSLYISCKERVEYQAKSAFSMEPGNCYNECIGQENFNPFINKFWVDEYEFLEEKEPCSSNRFYLFKDKVKAFPSPYDMLMDMAEDFWKYPPTALTEHVLPTLPDNPCDSCNCNAQFTDFLNFIIVENLIPAYQAGTPISNISFPISYIRLLFPKIFSEFAFPEYEIVALSDSENDGNVVITFSEIRCDLKFQLNISDILNAASIQNATCPNFNFDQITTDFSFEIIDKNGRTTKITASAILCDIACRQDQDLNCQDLNTKDQLLDLLNLFQQTQALNAGSGNHTYSVPVNQIGVELENSLRANGFNGSTSLTIHSNKNGFIINITNGLKICVSLNFNALLSGGNTHLNTSEITHFTDLIPRYPFAYLDGNIASTFYVVAHFADGSTTLCLGESCFGLATCRGDIGESVITNKKCAPSAAISGLLNVFNYIILDETTPIPTNYAVPTNVLGEALLDSLNITSSLSYINVPVQFDSSAVNIQFANCNISLSLDSNNRNFGNTDILFFSDLVPYFNLADATGNTYAFTIKAHLSNGDEITGTGKFLQHCFSLGRCCVNTHPTVQTRTKSPNNKVERKKTKHLSGRKLNKKKFPLPFPNEPWPGPTDPVLPLKPFDPLCDDCIPIDLVGGLFDTVDFGDCLDVWCDTSKWITVTLDSMPDPCIEHLYDVAEANAYILYEEIIDSITSAFMYAYNMKCLRAAETFNDKTGFAQHHFTLYYYDQSNNLVQTVPPNGVTGLNNSGMSAMATYRTKQRTHVTPNPLPSAKSIEIDWASQYSYNSLNQLTSQKIPDHGFYNSSNNSFVKEATIFWYDYLGRLICSQNPEQKKKNEFSYTLYDPLGRIKEVGGLKFTAASSQPPPSPADTTPWKLFVNNGLKFEITTTTYDHDFYNGNFPAGFSLSSVDNLRGRVGAAALYDTEINYNNLKPEYITHYSYDIHGNVKGLVQDGKNTPAKLMEYDYDLISGKVNKVWYQRGKHDQFIHDYRYDADNRLTLVRTSQNGILWDEDAHYIYYPHGPLARTELGEDEIQGLDYAYTLQGWIKGMNSGALNTQTDMGKDGVKVHKHKWFGQDVVGYVLNYYNGDYSSIAGHTPSDKFETEMTGDYNTNSKDLYNGNIRAMITAIRPFVYPAVSSGLYKGAAGYSYRYDQLNRIKGMDYYAGINNNSWGIATQKDDYQTRYSYDPNGNILNLDRNGTSAAGNQLKMDKFKYAYAQGNNRLTHVNDVINANNYTTDIDDQTSNNYKYDRIGNLIRDEAEGLSIDWNLSGKVSRIKKDNGDIILFKYDALGNRISKSFKDTITWYVRDASGNAMAHYVKKPPLNSLLQTWLQTSVTLYGSTRLGELSILEKRISVDDSDISLPGSSGTNTSTSGSSAREFKLPKPIIGQHLRGLMQYELTNHLGNVLATVSDRKKTGSALASETGLYGHMITVGDYYPEGILMPQRTYSTEQYDNKHQGQHSDLEVYGEGNSYYYKYRMSDPRLCRFWSVDPLHQKYPHYSNYQFSGNKLISNIEMEGLEEKQATKNSENEPIMLEVVNVVDQKWGIKDEIKKFFSSLRDLVLLKSAIVVYAEGPGVPENKDDERNIIGSFDFSFISEFFEVLLKTGTKKSTNKEFHENKKDRFIDETNNIKADQYGRIYAKEGNLPKIDKMQIKLTTEKDIEKEIIRFGYSDNSGNVHTYIKTITENSRYKYYHNFSTIYTRNNENTTKEISEDEFIIGIDIFFD